MMNKKIVDGKVAVLFAPGFGAGWSTWNTEHEAMLFDPFIVAMVEKRSQDNVFEELVEYCMDTYPGGYFGAVRDLEVAWIPEGKKFYIREYDGNEVIVLEEEFRWNVA